MVKQWRQTGPRLLVHPVALVENAHTAAQHRGDKRRSVILDPAVFTEDWSDQQVFRPGIGSALIDVELLLTCVCRRDRKRRFTDAWRADDSWSQRQILFVDDDPAGQQLPERLTLPDPVSF